VFTKTKKRKNLRKYKKLKGYKQIITLVRVNARKI